MPASQSAGARGRHPEAAPDEYQAPFTLPAKSQVKPIPAPAENADDEAAMAPSPFFDEAEHAEALKWAQSEEAIEDGEQAPGAVAIGSRRRRDSQVTSYGDVGSVFDGPTAGAVPSSVSSMRHTMTRPELSRKASSRARRRISRDAYPRSPSRSRKGSTSYEAGEGDEFDDTASAVSAGPASVRSSGVQSSRIGKKRHVPARGEEDDEAQESRGMLGSLLASIRGTDARQQDDDARSRVSRRPSLGGRRRSSTSSIGSRRSRVSSRRAGSDEEAEDDDEDDGFSIEYGSEDDDDDDDSLRSTTSDEDGGSDRGGLLPSAFGPLSGAVDPVFGDTRITTEHEPEDELDEELQNASGIRHAGNSGVHDPEAQAPSPEEELRRAREEMSYLDKDSRTRQQIYLPDEDTLIRLKGYRVVAAKRIVWTVLCVLSLGILYLLGRWLPKLWLRWTSQEIEFEKAEFIVIENQYGDLHLVHLETIPFARPLATAFPPSSRDPPSTLSEHQAGVQAQAQTATRITSAAGSSRGGSKVASARSSLKGGKSGTANGNGHSSGIPTADGELLASDEVTGLMSGVETEQLMELTLMSYRYTRFFLHPPSGRWRMVKDWRDPNWTSGSAVSSGISWDAEKDRTTLFGKNEIEIEDRGVVGLLIDEVLHPFYSE